MEKMRKKVSLFLAMLLTMVMAFSTEAAASENDFGEYDYIIDAYDVDIKVNEDNTFDITETVSVYFNVRKHGIYRTIPARNEVVRLDGSRAANKAQLLDVSVNEEFTVERTDGDYNIKIGSANYTVDGAQKYVISYHYNIGKDTLKDSDELYYNIIGTKWIR